MLIAALQRFCKTTMIKRARPLGNRRRRNSKGSGSPEPCAALQLLMPGRLGSETYRVFLVPGDNLVVSDRITTGIVAGPGLLIPPGTFSLCHVSQQDTYN